jgi:hypothetical protein
VQKKTLYEHVSYSQPFLEQWVIEIQVMRATGVDVFMQTSTASKRFSLNVLCGDISDKKLGPHISSQCLSDDSGV